MRITNELKLPQVLVDLIVREQREYVDGRYSVTELLNGTKEIILKRRHNDKLVTDVSEHIAKLFGTAFHHLFELNDKEQDKIEQKIEYAVTKDFTLSGRYDRSDDYVIEDYKTTRVNKYLNKDFSDYRRQGLMYAWIERKNGRYIDKLRFYLFLKDYTAIRSKSDSNYPKAQIQVWEYQITTSDMQEIESYIMDKANDILEANRLKDDEIPYCSEEQRWNSGTKYAVMKNGAKRATAVFNDLKEAQHATSNGYYIETRKGEDMKCDNYCEVKEYCNYWRKKQLWLD